MPLLSVPEPVLVNGSYPSYTNIEFTVAGTTDFLGITEINFSDSLEPGEARGNQPIRMGTTVGEYKAEGSFSIHMRHYESLIRILGPQYGIVQFEISVVYDMDDGFGLIRRTLEGCRIKKADEAHKQGTDALMVKVDLDVTRIRRGDDLYLV